MKQQFIAFLVLIGMPAFALAEVEISGYILSDTRLFSQKNNKFNWNENRFDLKLSADPLEEAQVYIEFWGRSFGFPRVNTSSDLMR